MSNYKVILVEDEYPARTVFRHMIEQRSDLFTFSGRQKTARKAWNYFCKINPS